MCEYALIIVKKSREEYDETGLDAFEMEVPITEGRFNFTYYVLVDREPKYVSQLRDKGLPFFIDANSLEDEIRALIVLDPKDEEKHYSELYETLQDYLEHELWHITQFMGLPDRAPVPPESRRKKLRTGSVKDYFLEPVEVEAMVRGMYNYAKKNRKPLKQVLADYLEGYVKDGYLTPEERDEVMSIWLDYARKNLPRAIVERVVRESIM